MRPRRQRQGAPVSPFTTVFLDRDGVLNRHRPGDYVKRWEEFEFLPQVSEALRLLGQAGCRLIVITNQRGIARGLMTEAALADIHHRMAAALAAAGVSLAGIYVCPHEHGTCDCRKPLPGLLHAAQRDIPDIDFATSATVGDSMTDIEAARAVGCRGFLVTGDIDRDRQWTDDQDIAGAAPSLYEVVVRFLLNETGARNADS